MLVIHNLGKDPRMARLDFPFPTWTSQIHYLASQYVLIHKSHHNNHESFSSAWLTDEYES